MGVISSRDSPWPEEDVAGPSLDDNGPSLEANISEEEVVGDIVTTSGRAFRAFGVASPSSSNTCRSVPEDCVLRYAAFSVGDSADNSALTAWSPCSSWGLTSVHIPLDTSRLDLNRSTDALLEYADSEDGLARSTARIVLTRYIVGLGAASSSPCSNRLVFSFASCRAPMGDIHDWPRPLIPLLIVSVMTDESEYRAGLKNVPVEFFLLQSRPIITNNIANAMKLIPTPITIPTMRSPSALPGPTPSLSLGIALEVVVGSCDSDDVEITLVGRALVETGVSRLCDTLSGFKVGIEPGWTSNVKPLMTSVCGQDCVAYCLGLVEG